MLLIQTDEFKFAKICVNGNSECGSGQHSVVLSNPALAVVCTPASAGDQAENLGPVGPHQPILTTVGGKRVLAFYLPGSGHCTLHALVWDNSNANSDASAARVRVSLEPGQILHIDTPEQKSLNLECGKNAEKLAIVDTDRAVAFGLTSEQPAETRKASASGF